MGLANQHQAIAGARLGVQVHFVEESPRPPRGDMSQDLNLVPRGDLAEALPEQGARLADAQLRALETSAVLKSKGAQGLPGLGNERHDRRRQSRKAERA